MRIKKTDKIDSIPLIKIRDFFRKHYRGFTNETVMRHFNLDIKETNSLMQLLLQNKFIVKKGKNDILNIGDYVIDDKGYMLCAAHSVPPISKAKADQIYSDFLQRVKEVNNDDYYLCEIEKIYLFGSYLDVAKEDYGDIDIGYKLKRKISNYNEYNKLRKLRIQEMEKKGKRFNTFNEELNFPEKEVILKLKNKCRYISLQPIDDDLFKMIKYKKVKLGVSDNAFP